VRTAVEWSDHTTQKRRLPPRLHLAHALAERLVYRRLREGLGGRLRAASSGGAPLSRGLAAFFHGAGLLVLEGYGMTELCSIVAANRPDAWRLGSVGLPGEGLQVRIADDGEVCVRGRTVMAGYWGQPAATAETIVDGWLHTGDIGHLDADGFLFITDRKKNLIVTAGGKNIAPAPIEARLKALCPALSEVVLLGDRRPCCIALVTLQDGEATTSIDAAVARLNDELPSWSTIKAWRALPAELTVESGELTPSLKVRRRVIEARYARIIAEAYDALARRDTA
jgi:long-chain acyl-CoA synthetase